MKIIVRKQGDRKTEELIRNSAENWYYMVVSHHKEAYRVSQHAISMGLNIPFPITYDDFLNHRYYGKGILGFLIDDVDSLLYFISGAVPIYAISLTEITDIQL